MPQPLSRVRPNADVTASIGALTNSPQFAMKVMTVIGYWAHIDGDLATIFSAFLKTEIPVGVAMYRALNGGATRRAVFLSAAEAALPRWKFLLTQAVIIANAGARAQRNDFAHHVWGRSDDLPDAMLLMPAEVVVDSNLSHRIVHEVDGANVIIPKGYDASAIMVYRDGDFDRAIEQTVAAQMRVIHLYQTVLAAPELGRRWLLSDDQVLAALQKVDLTNDPVTREILRPPAFDEPPPKGTHL